MLNRKIVEKMTRKKPKREHDENERSNDPGNIKKPRGSLLR